MPVFRILAIWQLLSTIGALALPECNLTSHWATGGKAGNVFVGEDCFLPQQLHGINTAWQPEVVVGLWRSGSKSALLPGLSPAILSTSDSALFRCGTRLLLKSLVLLNFSFPSASPSAAMPLWPAQIAGGPNCSLGLQDVLALTSPAVIAAQAAYFATQPNTTIFYTDGRSFLHVNYWAGSGGWLRSVGLVAPLFPPVSIMPAQGGDSLAVLSAQLSRWGSNSTVLLSVTNDTLPRALTGPAATDTAAPLLMYITTNVSWAGLLDGTPAALRRPVLLVGRAGQVTSLDFRMEVDTLRAVWPHSNITLDSLVMENLAAGGIATLAWHGVYTATAVQNVWAITCNRTEMRLLMHNLTLVSPVLEIQFFQYWAMAFNSDLPFLQQQSNFLRTDYGIQSLEYVPPSGPGDMPLVLACRSPGLDARNVYYTDIPQVAPPLPPPPPDPRLPRIVPGLSAPVVVLVKGEQDARSALTTASTRGNASLLLSDSQTWGNNTIAAASPPAQELSGPPPGALAPPPPAQEGYVPPDLPGNLAPAMSVDVSVLVVGVPDPTASNDDQGSDSGDSSGDDGRGPLVRLDLSFRPDLLKVTSGRVDAAPPTLQFLDLRLGGLPQRPRTGATCISSSTSSSGGGGEGASSGGGQLCASDLTCLMWAVKRDFAARAGTLALTNVALELPPAELALIRSLAAGSADFTLVLNLDTSGQGGTDTVPLSQALLQFTGVNINASASAVQLVSLRGLGLEGTNLTLLPYEGQLPASYTPPTVAPAPPVGGGSSGRSAVAWVALPLSLLLAVASFGLLLLMRRRRRRSDLPGVLHPRNKGTLSEPLFHGHGWPWQRFCTLLPRTLLKPLPCHLASQAVALSGPGSSPAADPLSDLDLVLQLQLARQAVRGSTSRISVWDSSSSSVGPGCLTQGAAALPAASRQAGEQPCNEARGFTPLTRVSGGGTTAAGSDSEPVPAAMPLVVCDAQQKAVDGKRSWQRALSVLVDGAEGSTLTAVHSAPAVVPLQGQSPWGLPGHADMSMTLGSGSSSSRQHAEESLTDSTQRTFTGTGTTTPTPGTWSGQPGGNGRGADGRNGGGSSSGTPHSPWSPLVELFSSALSAVHHRRITAGLAAVGLPPSSASPSSRSSAGDSSGGNATRPPHRIAGTGNSRSASNTAGRRVERLNSDQAVLVRLLGRGSFGCVWLGRWRGREVAVKVIRLTADDGGAGGGPEARRAAAQQRCAVMEAVVSTAMAHPNIVQVYTYSLEPMALREPLHSSGQASPVGGQPGVVPEQDGGEGRQQHQVSPRLGEGAGDWLALDMHIIMEYCDEGCLRSALNTGRLCRPGGLKGACIPPKLPDYGLVLSLLLDMCSALLHLHREGVLHGDLKASNVLLAWQPHARAGGPTAEGGPPGGRLVAKVADFGLSLPLEATDTHVSGMCRGTMTHMSPELLLEGRMSRASDVYALGVLAWELATGGHAFAGLPRALLGHAVLHEGRRPTWPHAWPHASYAQLVNRCWAQEPDERPSVSEVLQIVEKLQQGYLQQQEEQQQQQQHCVAQLSPDPNDTLVYIGSAALNHLQQQQQQKGAAPAPHEAITVIEHDGGAADREPATRSPFALMADVAFSAAGRSTTQGLHRAIASGREDSARGGDAELGDGGGVTGDWSMAAPPRAPKVVLTCSEEGGGSI